MPATATARVGDPDCRPFPGCRLSASRGTGEPTTRILGCSGVSGVRAGDGLSRSSAHEAPSASPAAVMSPMTKSGTRENKVAMQVASPTATRVSSKVPREPNAVASRYATGEARIAPRTMTGAVGRLHEEVGLRGDGQPGRRPRSPAAQREKLDGQGIGGSQPGEQHDATLKSVRPPDGPGEKGRDSSRCRRPSDSRPRRGRRRLRRGIHFASFLNT